MRRIFAVALGILTAIGGIVDIGDLGTNAIVGSRFGLGLAWVVLVGVVGICVYAQMSGRVAAAGVRGRHHDPPRHHRLHPRRHLDRALGQRAHHLSHPGRSP